MKFVIALALFPTLLLAQSRPATEPTAFDELTSAKAELEKHRAIKLSTVVDAARFSMTDGNLRVHTTVKNAEETARLEVPDLAGVNSIRVQGFQTDSPNLIELIHRTATPTTFMLTSIIGTPGRVQITRDSESDTDLMHVELMQSETNAAEGEPRVTLYVKLIKDVDGKTPIDLRLNAMTTEQLRRDFPDEVAKYLEPIFRDLQQEAILAKVDLRAAWQVFSDAAPRDEKIETQVKSVLAQLDAESFQERENATKKLEKLGQRAALVLMHHPRTSFSEEQKNRIDTFLAAYRPLSPEQVEKLRISPQFLIDCLYHEDADLSAAAVAQLAKVTRRQIDFDPKYTGGDRIDAIRRLRAQFTPATKATTAPTSAP